MNVEQPWHQSIWLAEPNWSKHMTTRSKKVKSFQTCNFEYLDRKVWIFQDLTAVSPHWNCIKNRCFSFSQSHLFHPMFIPFRQAPSQTRSLWSRCSCSIWCCLCCFTIRHDPGNTWQIIFTLFKRRFQLAVLPAIAIAKVIYWTLPSWDATAATSTCPQFFAQAIFAPSIHAWTCIHCKDFWWQEIWSESFLFLKLYLLLIRRHGSAIMGGADSWRISLNISQQLLHWLEGRMVLTG